MNATWDLLLKKPPIDTDGHCPPADSPADSSWFSEQVKKTYSDGDINDPNNPGKMQKNNLMKRTLI